MKPALKISISLVILLTIGYVLLMDISARKLLYSTHSHDAGFYESGFANTPADPQSLYQEHFGDPKYKFPRESVAEVQLVENSFIKRLTSKTISAKNRDRLVAFLNEPDNFSWGETTWDVSDAEYILKFYDANKNQIGKAWLCIADCGMIRSVPFSPNMKYGGLSKVGQSRLQEILKEILTE